MVASQMPRPMSIRRSSQYGKISGVVGARSRGTCEAKFNQAGGGAFFLGGRDAFLDDLGGRTYGGGSCPSYLSTMRSYFTPC
jgi:hypothetical protein